VVPAGENVLRFLSPLNVTDDEIDEAVVRFGRALRRAERSAS
jgi:acetylornithine/succinyldiaminopimelate/putrescine aminotransferase